MDLTKPDCSMKTETSGSPEERDLTGKPRTTQWSGGAENVEIKDGQRKGPLG